MKLLIINPNSDKETSDKIREKAARLQLPGVETMVTELSYMPRLITCYEDVARASEGMLSLVKGDSYYDAYLVGCHLDPNLELLREATAKPVMGTGEASIRMASLLCNSFAVISPSLRSGQRKEKMILSNHCLEQFRGAVVAQEDSKEAVLAAAEEAVERWHPEGIVLGCANYALWDGAVEAKYPVKCFDGIACGMLLAAGLSCYQKAKASI